VEFAVDIQPRPAGVKISLIGPDLIRRVFLFPRLILELMVVPGIVSERLKIEGRFSRYRSRSISGQE